MEATPSCPSTQSSSHSTKRRVLIAKATYVTAQKQVETDHEAKAALPQLNYFPVLGLFNDDFSTSFVIVSN
jgi:hypothetical protein